MPETSELALPQIFSPRALSRNQVPIAPKQSFAYFTLNESDPLLRLRELLLPGPSAMHRIFSSRVASRIRLPSPCCRTCCRASLQGHQGVERAAAGERRGRTKQIIDIRGSALPPHRVDRDATAAARRRGRAPGRRVGGPPRRLPVGAEAARRPAFPCFSPLSPLLPAFTRFSPLIEWISLHQSTTFRLLPHRA